MFATSIYILYTYNNIQLDHFVLFFLREYKKCVQKANRRVYFIIRRYTYYIALQVCI